MGEVLQPCELIPGQGKRVPVLTNHQGDAMLEWVILAAVILAVIGTALYAVTASISTKLQNVNAQIGS